jgi:signal transduction histidine kinase
MNEPGETGKRQSGPSFENAWGTCLLSGVLLYDGESGVATLSPEASQILGFSKDQGSEVPIERLPAGVSNLAREVLASGKPGSGPQLTIPNQHGAGFAHIVALPLKSISNHSAVVVTLHSLSSSGQFVQQIRQLDRLANTGTLAAGMAHEIKNALVAGRTFLDLLLEKNTDAELVEIVRQEMGRIDAIVSRMLRFAATNTRSLKALHLHEGLEHALRLVQPQLTAKSISLERAFRAHPDGTKGDEYELQQAFVNLLLNALEAMSEHGKLTVGTETVALGPDGVWNLRVVIEDTGGGILPEHMDRLFEPFFTTKASGTGLGLAITRRIIEEHGGSISVASRLGQGTTFTVFLPLLLESPGAPLGGFATATLGNIKG